MGVFLRHHTYMKTNLQHKLFKTIVCEHLLQDTASQEYSLMSNYRRIHEGGVNSIEVG